VAQAEGDAEAGEAQPEFRNNRGLASTLMTGEAGSAQAEKPSRAKPPVVYEVEPGDTVGSLANQFGVSVATILMANNISDPDLIKPGMELRVLPVSGVEHQVDKGESLADIAAAYKVDLGPIVDFNGLSDPDTINVGTKLVIPGATARVNVAQALQPPAPPQAQARSAQSPASAVAAAPRTGSASASAAAAASASAAAATRPAAPAAARPAAPAAAAPARAVPVPVVGAGGSGIARNAMAYNGYRYVFGGSSPAGFDCSGFVWYVHKAAGISISRGLWGQLNGGPRISRENLSPGDTVFFANTYMPGLSHAGIYIGGGSFIHAIDEGSGVGISSLSSSYWGARYIGAARLY
jgi:cell wall-associated NlpC family hydrolase